MERFELPVLQGRIDAHGNYEFPHCDMRHEALRRKRKPGESLYEDQCPQTCRQNRPACAHFAESDKQQPLDDPIEGDLVILRELGVPEASRLTKEYRSIRTRLRNGKTGPEERGMDAEMREARCGTNTGGDIPSPEEAKEGAAFLIPEHRSLVDRMQVVIGEIGDALQAILEKKRDSSMMGPCDAPSSSQSGSLQTQPSSSEPTQWPTDSALGSFSPRTSPSTSI